MVKSLGSVLERIRPLITDLACRLSQPPKYCGNIAITGGYPRDIMARKRPKDLDIFFDADHLRDMLHANEIGTAICELIGDGAKVTSTFASYGTWAVDVECVVRIELPEPTHYHDCLIPKEIDLVFLRPSQLKKFGYDGSEASFLAAMCSRVDLRLNALGVSPNGIHYSLAWTEDLAAKRLVVQKARLLPDSGDDMKRIQRRLERLALDKFKGWSIEYELHDGSLTPFLPAGITIIHS